MREKGRENIDMVLISVHPLKHKTQHRSPRFTTLSPIPLHFTWGEQPHTVKQAEAVAGVTKQSVRCMNGETGENRHKNQTRGARGESLRTLVGSFEQLLSELRWGTKNTRLGVGAASMKKKKSGNELYVCLWARRGDKSTTERCAFNQLPWRFVIRR